jgi:hypothetical protein
MKFQIDFNKVNGELISLTLDKDIQIAFPRKQIGVSAEEREVLAASITDLNLHKINFTQTASDYLELLDGLDILFYALEAGATNFKVYIVSETNKTLVFACDEILAADYSPNFNDFATTGLVESFLSIEYKK